MRYKREEAFRYTFNKPLSAFFSIYEINGKKVVTHDGEIEIMDLSPSGTKVRTGLNIPFTEQNPVKIMVKFILNNKEYDFKGQVVWKKIHLDSYLYGVHFLINDDMHEEIIQQLKLYVKSQQNQLS